MTQMEIGFDTLVVLLGVMPSSCFKAGFYLN
jgi:hypothetical protein